MDRYFHKMLDHLVSSSVTSADSDLRNPHTVVDGQGAVQYEGRINSL